MPTCQHATTNTRHSSTAAQLPCATARFSAGRYGHLYGSPAVEYFKYDVSRAKDIYLLSRAKPRGAESASKAGGGRQNKMTLDPRTRCADRNPPRPPQLQRRNRSPTTSTSLARCRTRRPASSGRSARLEASWACLCSPWRDLSRRRASSPPMSLPGVWAVHTRRCPPCQLACTQCTRVQSPSSTRRRTPALGAQKRASDDRLGRCWIALPPDSSARGYARQ